MRDRPREDDPIRGTRGPGELFQLIAPQPVPDDQARDIAPGGREPGGRFDERLVVLPGLVEIAM